MQCLFCSDIIQSNQTKTLPIHQRILYDDGFFVVFPALGHFVPGYLLIAPKEHYVSVSTLPEKIKEDLEQVQTKVKKILSEVYGPVIFFEHGPASRKGGCCIEHAHVHAVPVHFNLDTIELPSRQIQTYTQLPSDEYLFVEDHKGVKQCYQANNLPSQLMRRKIAQQLNIPERWDWGVYEGREEMQKTYDTLLPRFQALRNRC